MEVDQIGGGVVRARRGRNRRTLPIRRRRGRGNRNRRFRRPYDGVVYKKIHVMRDYKVLQSNTEAGMKIHWASGTSADTSSN